MKRIYKRIIKFKKIIVISALIALVSSGILWQSIMVKSETNTFTPIGQHVDVGTYKAHCYLKGDGATAFVFIAGSGTPCSYTDFYNMQNELSHLGQTITFDHAGSGWSTETKSERSIENLVKELSIIIDEMVPEKPIVLICHSLGSLEAIGYAQTYPERVKGIIFLDSGSPQFYSTYSELVAKFMNRSVSFVRSIGINRLLGECGFILPVYGENIRNQQLPDDLKDLDKAMYYRFAGNPLNLNTINNLNENATIISDGTKLGDIPILVLSSESGSQWNDVQTQLASWSENSKQITIEGSKHYLYWSSYEETLECINDFIKISIQ